MAATGAPSEGSEDSRDRRGMVTGQDEYPAELRLKDTLLRAARVGLARHTSGTGSVDNDNNNNNDNDNNKRISSNSRNSGSSNSGGGSNSGNISNGRKNKGHMGDHFGGENQATAPPAQPQPQQQRGGAPPPPPPPGGVDRNVSLLDLNDDENNLRTTCDACTIGKIKCDGGHPCKRCQRRGSECVYREKKRCGPKRRKLSSRDDSDDDGSHGGSFAGHLGEGGAGVRVLTSREQEFLAKFYSSVNKFIPLTCLTVIRDAMNPLPLDVVPGLAASEAEENTYHARKAVLLGCVAVGAVFCGDQASAGAYMTRAQTHLKDCFDALIPEVVSCYLVMVVYHLHFLDRSKVYRYIGFAQQACRELAQSNKLGVGGHVRDSLRVLSTFLHVTCNNEIRPEEVDLRAETNPEPGGGSLSRIIALFSHVLLQLYRKTDRVEAARASPQQPVPTMATLGTMANEAELLLSMMEDPGSFAVIVIKTLKGYFLLMKGKEQAVLDAVAMPVAKALEADPAVLNFPLCWTMCQCVSSFLRRKGCHSVAASMDAIMQPLRLTLAYANACCGVALNVVGVYAGKGITVTPVSGLFPPGTGPAPADVPSPSIGTDTAPVDIPITSMAGGGGGGGGGSSGFSSPRISVTSVPDEGECLRYNRDAGGGGDAAGRRPPAAAPVSAAPVSAAPVSAAAAAAAAAGGRPAAASARLCRRSSAARTMRSGGGWRSLWGFSACEGAANNHEDDGGSGSSIHATLCDIPFPDTPPGGAKFSRSASMASPGEGGGKD
ncbi:unnamed protein product [Ectocarpus sp. 6 AP-2014]